MVAFSKEDWTTVTIRCIQCGELKKLQVKQKDLADFKAGKGYVQTLFPYLSPGDRELFISRICGECFDKMFPPEVL